jgi:apolipoprotein N-acyltransferase
MPNDPSAAEGGQAPSPAADVALRVLATVGSAASLSLIAPPLNWHPLHWFAYLPMFWALREDRPRLNAALAVLYGTVAVGLIFRWIADTISLFSNIPAIGAYGILLLFSLVFGLPYLALWAAVHPLRRRLGDGWVFAVPALQVVIEYVSMYALLFPYNQGVSQYRFPFTWQLASVTGVWGLSFLVLFVNCVLAEGIYRAREGRPFPIRLVSTAAIVWSCVVIWGWWRFNAVEDVMRAAPTLKVAQLQSNTTMRQRIDNGPRVAFEYWARRTAEIKPGSVDLVVWPEGGSPYSLQSPNVGRIIHQLATHGRFEMLVGGGARERDTTSTDPEAIVAFNSVYYVDKNGEVTQRYDKMHPLPFGEYLPFAHTKLAFLLDWIEGVGDFRAGTEAVVLQGSRFRYSTPICYEAILSQVCRQFDRPDLMVTVTNDAWFGDTGAPWQHGMLAAVRATELGVPMYRSAYTGVSFVAEPNGTIYAETQPFTETGRVVTVRMGKVPTIYARFGDWFVAVCAAGLAATWLAAPWVRARAAS